MDDFSGRVVVVTGGSRGIGAHIVRAFASRGADVVIASRRLASCETLATEIHTTWGVRALPIACNVSDWDQCDELVSRVRQEWEQVDVLVNNAGLSPHYPSLEEVSQDLFDKVVAVNLRGPFRLMATLGSDMAAGHGGSIVNIGSVSAIRPQAEALPYAASKAGLHVLTEGFAKALAPKVRVNTVQPGPVLTEISANWAEQTRQEAFSSVALGRCAEPDEIVGSVLFFASSASSYSTGAVLRVDGGWR